MYRVCSLAYRGRRAPPILAGFSFGLLPCGLSFAVPPFAILLVLRGRGAILMAVSGSGFAAFVADTGVKSALE